PPEQVTDAAPQPEEPLDHRGRRRAPGNHHGPQVLDRTSRAAPRERNRPCVLQRDVVEQCVHAKWARAKFVWLDAHRQALPVLRLLRLDTTPIGKSLKLSVVRSVFDHDVPAFGRAELAGNAYASASPALRR